MKYAAIVAAAVWLAVVLWIGGLVLRTDPVVRFVVPPTAAADTVALQTDTARVRQALAAIEPLRRAQMSASSALPVLIATVATGSVVAPALATSDATRADGVELAPERKVSLVYYAPGFRRAVIDGVYVRPGSRLPGGARVVDIFSDAVVLRDAQGRRVIKVARDGVGAGKPNEKVSR